MLRRRMRLIRKVITPPREPLPDLQNCTTYYNTQGSSSSSTLSLLSIGSPLVVVTDLCSNLHILIFLENS